MPTCWPVSVGRCTGQVAELIERLHGDEPDALDDHLDLAYHYSEAALWDKALDYGLRAGQRALALYAPRTAVELLSRALSAATAAECLGTR